MGFRIFSRDVGGKLLGLVLALTGSVLWSETASACHATSPGDRVVHPTPECDRGTGFYSPEGVRCTDLSSSNSDNDCRTRFVGADRERMTVRLVICPVGGSQTVQDCSGEFLATRTALDPNQGLSIRVAQCRSRAERNTTLYPDGVPVRTTAQPNPVCPPSSRDRNPTLNIPVRPNNPAALVVALERVLANRRRPAFRIVKASLTEIRFVFRFRNAGRIRALTLLTRMAVLLIFRFVLWAKGGEWLAWLMTRLVVR